MHSSISKPSSFKHFFQRPFCQRDVMVPEVPVRSADKPNVRAEADESAAGFQAAFCLGERPLQRGLCSADARRSSR